MQIWKCTNIKCRQDQILWKNHHQTDKVQCPSCWAPSAYIQNLPDVMGVDDAAQMLKKITRVKCL